MFSTQNEGDEKKNKFHNLLII